MTDGYEATQEKQTALRPRTAVRKTSAELENTRQV